MIGILDRVSVAHGEPKLSASGLSVAEGLGRLEAGEAAADVFGGEPLDLVAAIAFAALGDESSPGPTLVRRPPGRPGLVVAVAESALARLFPRASRPARLALDAGLLQVLDAWEESHEAAQEADDLGEGQFSAFWHGIAHRREPDPGNATYWFRRVGRHPLYPSLADVARRIIDEDPTDLVARRVVSGGAWDPTAMIDACCRAKGRDAESRARRLQRREMALLLDATARAVAPGPSGD